MVIRDLAGLDLEDTEGEEKEPWSFAMRNRFYCFGRKDNLVA